MSSVTARPSCSGGSVFVVREKTERKDGISFFPLLALKRDRFPAIKPSKFSSCFLNFCSKVKDCGLECFL